MNSLSLQTCAFIQSNSLSLISRTHLCQCPAASSLPFSFRNCRVLRSLSRTGAYRSFASDHELPTRDYEFQDGKGEVEVKVKLPRGKTGIGASNVFVDAQDTSLSITLALPSSLVNVLPLTRLYGRIKASETVWFVDEEEVVVSLKKLDREIAWPGLEEEWGNLTKGVASLLKGVPVYLVGQSTDINWAVAQKLAEGLNYVPMQTSELLEKAARKSLENMLTEEGADAVADAEATILASLNTHGRLVVGTLGGYHGAASDSKRWNYLQAGVTVWLSLSAATDEVSAEEEAKQIRLEGSNAYANAEVVVALSGWEEGASEPAAEGCLKALKYLLESQKDIAAKKNWYVRLGCLGDWRNVQPPRWESK